MILQQGWRHFVDSLSMGAIVHGEHGEVVYANPQASVILGRSQSELRDRQGGAADYWAPLDLQGRTLARSRHPITLSLADGEPRGVMPLGVRRPDASIVWISLRTSILGGEGGRRQVLATFSDISNMLGGGLVAGPPEPLDQLVREMARRLEVPVGVVSEVDREVYQVQAIGHPDPDQCGRLEMDLVGRSMRISTAAIARTSGALASTARVNWRLARATLASHEWQLLSRLGAGGEILCVELPRKRTRAWLLVLRPRTARVLEMAEILELRRVAARASNRLRLTAARTRKASEGRRLELLEMIVRSISSSTDPQFALDNSLRLLNSGLQLDAAALWAKVEGPGKATCLALTGFQAYDMRRESRAGAVLARVFQGSASVTRQPLAEEPLVRRELVELEGFVFQHVAVITVRGRPVGALELFHRGPVDVDEGWIAFVGVAAAALAPALLESLGVERVDRKPQAPDLTPAQRRVLALALEGLDGESVAQALHLSPHTVKYHLANLYRRFEVPDRVALISKVARLGWL